MTRQTKAARDPVPFALEHFDRLPDEGQVSIDVGAKVAGISRMTLYRRINAGQLQLRKDGGRSHLIVGDLRRYLRGEQA